MSAEESFRALPWASIGARLVSLRVAGERKDSVIAMAVIERGGAAEEVVVKQHRGASIDGRPAEELARHEFETLTKLGTGVEDGVAYGAPAALLVDERQAIVVIGVASGTPLDAIIRHARRRGRPDRLREPLRRAGAWLRLMQGRTRSDDDPAAYVGAAVDEALRNLAGSDDGGVPAEAVARRVRELGERVAASRPPLAGRHVDFWPGNVFIAERRVDVIDYEAFRPGLPLEDAVYFLMYLERLPLSFLDGGMLRRAFLAGYRAPLDPDQEAFSRLTTLLRLRARTPAGARRRFDRAVVYLLQRGRLSREGESL